MAAGVRISHFNGASQTANNVDSGAGGTTPKWGLDDAVASTTPITIPSTPATTYSFYKALGLEVTTTDSLTSMSNRKVYYDASTPNSMPAGLMFYFKAAAVADYAQAATGNKPADGASGLPTPSTYTQMTTTGQTYQAGSVACNSAGVNGGYCLVVLGVDNTYAGGASSATVLPNLHLVYDES